MASRSVNVDAQTARTDVYVTDGLGRQIQVPANLRRIDGLRAEDKVRTLTLFRPGNYAEHPTAPIDIAPSHDLLQGLGTHVKSVLVDDDPHAVRSATLELASTLEFTRLSGHQRYFLMLYVDDGRIAVGGRTYTVRRYHTAIEIILSHVTLAAMRGGYTLEHLAWIQRRLDACQPTLATIKADQARFRLLMAKFERFFGEAVPSVKISVNKKTGKVDNKRVQSSIPIHRAQKLLSPEGPYQGRFTQPNYREWHEGEAVYGLKLPWFTIATDRIFSKTIGDPAAPMDDEALQAIRKRVEARAARRVIHPPASGSPAGFDDPTGRHPLPATQRTFKGGMLTIARLPDKTRVITVDAVDGVAFADANATCARLGARSTDIVGRWLASYDVTRRIVEELEAEPAGSLPPPEPDHVDPLPEAPEKDPLRPNPRNPRHFFFNVDGKVACAHLMAPHGNWALMDNQDPALAARLTAACAPYAPQSPWDGNHKGDWTLRYNHKAGTWLVRDQPQDLIRRVVRMIQEYKA